MSDFSLRRILFLSFASFLLAAAAFALSPAPRVNGRMVYDPVTTHTILFGGNTPIDSGTKVPYELDDTWDWNGVRWTQLYPLHVPPARYGQVMVYDTKRSRIVMFGGRTGNSKQDLNDTWIFQGGDWTQLQPQSAPPARVLAGGAYDAARDRVVLFGGATITADLKTTTPFYDTWEFDGTNWTKALSDGPHLDKPLLAYDSSRNQTILVGIDQTVATHQYLYDPAAPAWSEKTNTQVPTCANEGAMVFQSQNNTIFYTGGVCTGSGANEDNLEWDGDKWNVITVKTHVGRLFGAAMAYDVARQTTWLFGGNPISGLPRNEMWGYTGGDWNFMVDVPLSPLARSLFVFSTDPSSSAIWLFGGLDASTFYEDLWRYQYGRWERLHGVTNDGPQACYTPTGGFDTARNKLVVDCSDSSVWEFDVATSDWKSFVFTKNVPQPRRFSSGLYDPNLKKTVQFGGYATDYIDETWLWDGSAWTQIRKDLPPARALAAMWFDPILNRTVIFGGIGRQSSQDRITRFNDMWSFDGTAWTEIKPTTVPPPRYGAQVAVDPRTNTVLLFGGLRLDTIETPGTNGNPPTTSQVQVYADDFWQWDGHDWKQVTFPRVPYARENGGMAFDPTLNTLVVFGGYAGQRYFSDLWKLTDTNGWQPVYGNVAKKRATGH